MEIQDKEHLQARMKDLRAILKAEHSKKKTDRDERLIAQTKQSIEKVNEWMGDKPAVVTAKTEAPKPFTKEEFKDHMKVLGYDTSKPGAVMEITTRKQIDQMWPWLHTANVQLKIKKHLVAYFRAKMDKETDRPYKSITK